MDGHLGDERCAFKCQDLFVDGSEGPDSRDVVLQVDARGDRSQRVQDIIRRCTFSQRRPSRISEAHLEFVQDAFEVGGVGGGGDGPRVRLGGGGRRRGRGGRWRRRRRWCRGRAGRLGVTEGTDGGVLCPGSGACCHAEEQDAGECLPSHDVSSFPTPTGRRKPTHVQRSRTGTKGSAGRVVRPLSPVPGSIVGRAGSVSFSAHHRRGIRESDRSVTAGAIDEFLRGGPTS